jgi:agmatine deiminase
MSFRQPPEWAAHEWVWIGFPSHEELWQDDLEPARLEVAAFATHVHANGAGEEVRLVVADPASGRAAAALAPFATIVMEPFGDIWLRDTAPIVLKDGGRRLARSFRFNGWGGKYELAGDDDIGRRLAEGAGLDTTRFEWILEGGAIDTDGSGLYVTTEQCLLNPNRNPGMGRKEVEDRLRSDLGAERVLWLGEGLANDHTDGHVDNLARFVGPNRLAVPDSDYALDVNRKAYGDAARRAEAFGVEVVRLPSPGPTERDGEIVPASYMNFYIGNAAVVVPLYGRPHDAAALDAIAALFPGRRTIGFDAHHVLTGGGSFHCISQQVPV